MMNKKGTLVLRDVMFMMLIVSSIFVFAGLFVGDMATRYDNDNMSEEWAVAGTNTSSNSMFNDVGNDLNETGAEMSTESTGLWGLITSVANTLEGIGNVIFMVLTAPNTIGDLVYATLVGSTVPGGIAITIKYLIVGVLWGVILFGIASAFLKGGKM